jgi:hypothetical protein
MSKQREEEKLSRRVAGAVKGTAVMMVGFSYVRREDTRDVLLWLALSPCQTRVGGDRQTAGVRKLACRRSERTTAGQFAEAPAQTYLVYGAKNVLK